VLGDIACALAGCTAHRKPFSDDLDDLDERMLDIWLTIVKATTTNPILLTGLCRIMQHTKMSRLATALERPEMLIIVEKVWEGMILPDRKSRVLAG
jgi:hypothetical protein